MTPEQLDEIEKLAEAATPGPWVAEKNAALITAMHEYALPLVKALREAWEALDEREGDMHARIRAGYDKSVADSWRAHCAKIEKERDEARAEVERLRQRLQIDPGGSDRIDELEDALTQVREKNGSLADRIENTDSELRDAWKAEDRLRSTLRLLWEEATDEERCANERAPGCYSHALSQPCREAVEAALKDSP